MTSCVNQSGEHLSKIYHDLGGVYGFCAGDPLTPLPLRPLPVAVTFTRLARFARPARAVLVRSLRRVGGLVAIPLLVLTVCLLGTAIVLLLAVNAMKQPHLSPYCPDCEKVF